MLESVTTKAAGQGTYWKRIVAILTAGWIVIWIYRDALTPVYSTLSAYFGGASDTALGTISSCYFLGYVVMQIPSGLLVDRFGQKRVIVPGFSLFALGAAVVALSQSLPMLYVGSVLAGLGCGTFYGCAYSLTAENVPLERKSLATAIVNSGSSIGSGLGIVLSSALVRSGSLPWQTMVVVAFFLILLMVFVFSRVIRPAMHATEAQAADASEAPSPSAAADASGKAGIRSLFKPQVIAACALYFATMYAYYLIDTWLPSFLEAERGFEGTAIGLASSLVPFSAIPGALIFSRLADKLPQRKDAIIICLELVSAAMLTFMINTGSQPLLVAGIVLYGFTGKLAVEPIIISWLSSYAAGGSVATMYGVFNFFGMSSSIIAPAMTGVISDATGSKILGFYVAITIVLVGTLLFYLANRRFAKEGS